MRDHLRTLLSLQDDNAGHHVVWVDFAGFVHIDTVPDGEASAWFAKDLPNCALRFGTLMAGNGYVGKSAAADDEWVGRLYQGLMDNWPVAKSGSGDTYCDKY